MPGQEFLEAGTLERKSHYCLRSFEGITARPGRTIEPVAQKALSHCDFVDINNTDHSAIKLSRKAVRLAVSPFAVVVGEPLRDLMPIWRKCCCSQHSRHRPIRLYFEGATGIQVKGGPQDEALGIDGAAGNWRVIHPQTIPQPVDANIHLPSLVGGQFRIMSNIRCHRAETVRRPQVPPP